MKVGNNVSSKVEKICKWKIQSTENLLKRLLERSWDELATKYAEFYIENANIELLKF